MFQAVMDLQQSLHNQQTPSSADTNTVTPSGAQQAPSNVQTPFGATTPNVSPGAGAAFGAAPPAAGGADFQSVMQRVLADPSMLRQMETFFSNSQGNQMGDMLTRMFGNTSNTPNTDAATVPPSTRYAHLVLSEN